MRRGYSNAGVITAVKVVPRRLMGAKAGHQAIKEFLLLVLFAVVDANAAGMVPQFGGDEEKP